MRARFYRPFTGRVDRPRCEPGGSQAQLEAAADRVALAAILDASGRYREAAATLRDALTVYERVLGPGHYEVAGVLEDLAGVAERAGEPERGGRAARAGTADPARGAGPHASEVGVTTVDQIPVRT